MVGRQGAFVRAAVVFAFLLVWAMVPGTLSDPEADAAANDPSPGTPGAGEVRGVWIHTYGPYDWDTAMRRLRDAGFNSVFVRVGRGGNVIYPSRVLPRDAWAEKAKGDELKRAIDAAHRYGLDFHAWRVCYHMRSAPKEYYERMAAQDRLVRDADGKQSYWANPADPRNTDTEVAAVMEVVRKYNIDGLHLDYIRYPDAPHWDFDYGPVSRAGFEKAIGRKVACWPADVISGPLKRDYEEWERQAVNALVERIYKGVKKAKPKVQVSAAVWRNHRRYRAVIKQDWPLWVERGWLDFVVPMDYTTDNAVFAEAVKEQVSATDGRMPMVAGIGLWLMEAGQAAEQVELARRAGAAGYVLFAYNARQMDDVLTLFAKGVHARPAQPAYRAPRIEMRLGDALARKDAPYAVTAAAPLAIEARWLAPGHSASTGMRVRLEDGDGRCLADLGAVSARHARLSASVPAPEGCFQVVARGGGAGKELVVRGPLGEGLPAAVVEELRARVLPPQVPGPGLRVGVYDGGMGARGILEALGQCEGIAAFPLYHLKPDHLVAADAIILPQPRDVADLDSLAEKALRDWVSEGRTLILTHDAVGFRWHPALFPEVGSGSALAKRQSLQVSPEGAPAWTLEYAYRDHVRIAPAAGASVLARESGEKGAPVVVAGAFGKGRVILAGVLPGVQDAGKLLPGEVRLLRELLPPGPVAAP